MPWFLKRSSLRRGEDIRWHLQLRLARWRHFLAAEAVCFDLLKDLRDKLNGEYIFDRQYVHTALGQIFQSAYQVAHDRAILEKTDDASMFLWLDQIKEGTDSYVRNFSKRAAASGEESEIALTPVAPEKQQQPCLDASLARKIGEGALHIEHYVKSFQDIEWSVNKDNQVIYLQATPLQLSAKAGPDKGQLLAAARNYPLLFKDKGVIASRGIGAGTVFHVQSEEDCRHFPRGAVLVTRHTSPRMSKIVPLASAVVTDLGAVTGHMATICREYRVPTIVGTGRATRILEPGTDVTVDAEENVIYRGIVKELLTAQLIEKIPYEETYEFKLLRRALKRVSTLHLTDPQSSEFDAGHCRTFHDIIRFGHEMAVRKIAEVIQPSQLDASHSATKLRLPIPLDLTVVDIGGGIKRGIPFREASL
jgi:phosphohistidine swiveling domain-containing protein